MGNAPLIRVPARRAATAPAFAAIITGLGIGLDARARLCYTVAHAGSPGGSYAQSA